MTGQTILWTNLYVNRTYKEILLKWKIVICCTVKPFLHLRRFSLEERIIGGVRAEVRYQLNKSPRVCEDEGEIGI